jgi:ribosome-associated toxin RatA of RatAB toxin-antitoxin module
MFIYLGNFVYAQEFEMAASKNGITIESRKVVGYSTKEIRSSMICKSTVEKFFNTITNFSDYGKWVPYFERVKVIRKYNDTEYLYQMVIDPPLIQDRDMVTSFIRKSAGINQWTIEIKSKNDAYPKDEACIRFQRFVGVWKIKKISDTQIHLQFVNVYDISGSIPGFLMNLAGTKAPMETFEKLKMRLEN